MRNVRQDAGCGRGGPPESPRPKQPDPLREALRQRRLDLGWTQADLAERLFVNHRTVSDFETSRKALLAVPLLRYAEALDCDIVLVPRSAPPPQVTDEMAGVVPRKGRALQESVLRLSASGMSARAIAEQLKVSRRTITRWRTEATRRAAARDGQTVPPADQSVAA